ncbi:Asp-tRNA(Asn)/Glu-tRNA(Gln) amidotransferase subunit GatC [Rickettsiaceae bacterium]|nr:Asp-tRNA(Asn)/Glu-tRNA(Gln) amidotransferase subunit GatC [Rickettsiaceae bacterium]
MIQDKELQKLQKLAKLNFTEKELQDFAPKLNSVMEMIDQLQNVDCSSVEPLRSVCDTDQRMRQDAVKESDASADLFKNIPEKGSDFAKEIKCFVVPKVIE